jgi:hypothetical protein
MKRLTLWCLSGCMAAGITACSATSTAAPSPTSPATAPAAPVTATSTAVSPSGQPVQSGQSGRSEVAVVTDYYQAVVARDYRRAFSYLAATATGPDGQRLTWPAFLQLAHGLDDQGGPVIHFSVGGHPSQIVMTNSRQKYGPYHAHLQIARTADGWAITSVDRI